MTIRYGYDEDRNFSNSTAGGFATLEEAEATLRSHRPAAAPVADFSKTEQSVLAPPQTKLKREHITFEPLYPDIPRDQRHNFRIDDQELGYGIIISMGLTPFSSHPHAPTGLR